MANNKKYRAEVDFKEVFTNPSRWFGLLYVLLVVAIIIAGRYFVINQDNISDNDTEYVNVNRESRPMDIEQKKGQTLEGVDVKAIGMEASEDLLRQGEELYTNNCASCHGDEGKGNGIAGAALNPPPRNFHEETGWTNGRKISEMYKTLEEGIIENGMNSYSFLPVEDRFAIIHYVRSFADFPEPTEEELENLDLTYNLSEGMKTNNQIPVAKAIEIVSDEKMKRLDEFDNMLNSIGNHELFDKITDDKYRALNTLFEKRTWLNDINKFKSLIYNSMPQNGFNGKVNELTNEEWIAIHSKLNGLIAAN